MSPAQAASRLIAARMQMIAVAEAYPEVGLLVDRATDDIDLAGRVVLGEVELTACEACGCTVQDGECPTGGECDG